MQRNTRNELRRPQTTSRKIETPPLSDQRFQQLLNNASAFFAQAEGHTEEERRQVIQDIRAQMSAYGLSTDDLV